MSTRRKIILGVAIVLLVAVVTAVVIFRGPIASFVSDIFTKQDTELAPGTPLAPGQQVDTEAQRRFTKATEVARESGPKAGQAVLDEALDDVTDVDERANIYIQKSILAGSDDGGSDTTSAFEYAYQAEEEAPSYGTALYVADMEYYIGDKSKALEYYKSYLERLDDDAINLNPGDKEAIEKRVAELEASL